MPQHHNIYIFCIIYMSIINFSYAVSECTVFKYYFLFLLSDPFIAGALKSANPLVIVTVSFTSMYYSLWSHRLDFSIVILISFDC